MAGVYELECEQEAQGWNFTAKSVCDSCVDEEALEKVIREKADSRSSCDFCGRSPAAELDVLLDAFFNGLHHEYVPAGGYVPWDGREGGYQWPTTDSIDLVCEFGYVFVGDGLLDAVIEATRLDTMAEFDFITRRRDVALSSSWEEFCEIVKYRTRYVFWRLPIDEDLGAGEIPPELILDQVGRLVEEYELIRVLPAGECFWRAQAHEEEAIEHSANRLGTAPPSKALAANRMSPAGIPKFYGTVDVDTAIREVAYGSDCTSVTWGQFELTADSLVVDLAGVPDQPSMFDPELGSQHRYIRFLRRFVDQISERVASEHEQIEYVPTQIVTEYMLHVFRGGDIGGVLYPSSITGTNCVVLDVPNKDCLGPSDDLSDSPLHLRLVQESVDSRMITVEDRQEMAKAVEPDMPDSNGQQQLDF